MEEDNKEFLENGAKRRTSRQSSAEEYSKLAQEGIQLMLNNKFDEAEQMFKNHTDESLHMAAGYSYLTFMVFNFCKIIYCNTYAS